MEKVNVMADENNENAFLANVSTKIKQREANSSTVLTPLSNKQSPVKNKWRHGESVDVLSKAFRYLNHSYNSDSPDVSTSCTFDIRESPAKSASPGVPVLSQSS